MSQEGLNAAFVPATVQEPTYLYERVLAPDAEVLERVSVAMGSRALAVAEALFDAAGVAYVQEIVSGKPVPALIDIAERFGCDAIAMGTHGCGALRSALMGSVSQRILQASRVPVTVVKHLRPDQAVT